MKCLNCGGEMMNHLVHTNHGHIGYDICEACGGLWLDKGELDRMAFEVEGSAEASSATPVECGEEPAHPCPRCEGVALHKVKFLDESEITLDRCDNCGGFWLDGGEIDRVNSELTRIMPVAGRGFSDFVTGVHMPYWSRRVKVRSSETDFAVEVPIIKGARRLADTDRTCPACSRKLGQYAIFGIEFEGCQTCHGIFLDSDELRRLKDRQGDQPDLRWLDDEITTIERSPIAVSDRCCPGCPEQKLMTAICDGTRVLLDYCVNCHGIWLDAGEFQEILQALRSRLNDMTTPEAARKVWEEIKDIWGGPEGAIGELLDAKAAISALINIAIFSNPTLHAHAAALADAGRKAGLA